MWNDNRCYCSTRQPGELKIILLMLRRLIFKVTKFQLPCPKCMIKIFRGEGVVDGEGGSSERWLKWGDGVGDH